VCDCLLHLQPAGGSGKSTMACQLYNRLAHGVQEANLPGFGSSARAFIELEGRKTQDQLRPLLLETLEQLGATGFNKSASAAELSGALARVAKEQRILLVLDNVWTEAQLDLLLPRELHADSRVIVTSRADVMPQSGAWQVRAMGWRWCTHVRSPCHRNCALQLGVHKAIAHCALGYSTVGCNQQTE